MPRRQERGPQGIHATDAKAGEITDCLHRAVILPPTHRLRAERCIATIATATHLGLLGDMLASLNAHGNCQDALVVVFCVDGDSAMAQRVAEYGAVPILCRSLVRVNQTIKSVLYSVAEIVDADYFLCLDADILVTADLSPLFSMLRACPQDRILVSRDAGQSYPGCTLGRVLTGFYEGAESDIRLLLGSSARGEANYRLVVNDGVFAGSRHAVTRLEHLIRSWAPQAPAWIDRKAEFGMRNQFVFNLALAHLDCAIELDETFNWQNQTRRVALSTDGSQTLLSETGQQIRVLHFCGSGRPKQAEYRERWTTTRAPVRSTAIDLAIVTVKREDDYFHATLQSMQADAPIDIVIGSLDADYLECYRGDGRLRMHATDPRDWASMRDLDIPRKAGWNYWRALTLAADSGRGIAIFEDDVLFGNAWRQRLEQAVHAAEEEYGDNYILSLYCPYGFIAEGDNRGKLIIPYPLEIFAGFQGMYYPSRLRRRFAEYLKAYGVDSYRTHHDLLVKDFLGEAGIPLLTTSPSLVQHVGYKTTGFGACHMSPLFLGEKWPR